MAKKIIIANWKMNPSSLSEAKSIFSSIKRISSKSKSTIVVAPPFVYLNLFNKSRGKVFLGSQDLFWENSGAYTGEIGIEILRSLKVDFAILGHSERRALGESDEFVSRKVKASISSKITPVVCVGERERDSHGRYLEELKNQIKRSLHGVSKKDLAKVVIAYEPVWAIGKSAKDAINPERLHEMVIFLRKVLSDAYGRQSAYLPKIIYGGSVEPGNAKGLLQSGEVSGFLVGHASLEPEKFKAIVETAE